VQPLYSAERISDWKGLARSIGQRKANTSSDDLSRPLVASLRFLEERAKATHVVVEHRYIDRDHRSAFSHFYSRQFHSTPNVCARYHFFAADDSQWDGTANQLVEIGDYLGYIIQRPTPDAPLGRSILAVKGLIPGARVYCASEFEPHLDVHTCTITGVPFAQQDSVVMRCAETAIWTAARIMHKHFDHPLILPADITSPVTIGFSSHGRLIPSGGLSTDQMAHALTMLDLGPIVYDKKSSTEKWDPLRLVTAYLASSIPVILGVPGHAVTACGLLENSARRSIKRAALRSAGEWVSGLVIQDDALGPYRLMPRDLVTYGKFKRTNLDDLLSVGDPRTPAKKRWWLTAKDIDGVIVPLPDRIYHTAHNADSLTRKLLDSKKGLIRECSSMIAEIARTGSTGAKLLLDAALGKGGLVYSLRCMTQVKARQSTVTGNPRVRELLRNTPLPRHVWVAEFTSHDLFTHSDPNERKVLGEFYFDATAPTSMESALVFAHCMGVVLIRPDLCNGDAQREEPIGIPDDEPFYRSGIPLWTDA